jgi:hypothetical protein
MLGAACARATASAMCSGVMRVPGAYVAMQPFCAPRVRSTRVRRRVSMSAMATVPSRCRYCDSGMAARKLDTRSGRSFTTRPAAWTFEASTSSALTPQLPMCGYVSVTICWA